MKLFIKSKKNNIDAQAEYNVEKKEFIILKNSIISESVATSKTFNGNKITKRRNGTCKNNKVIENVIFKSASTAANYVTGRSTNGLIAWKDENGTKLRDLIERK